MDNLNRDQLELFSQPVGSAEKGGRACDSFSGYLLSHEKIVILIICFILTGIVSFSLGVEKGKRVAMSGENILTDTAVKPQLTVKAEEPISNQKNNNEVISPASAIKEPLLSEPTEQEIEQAKPSDKTKNYTIQLASYKSRKVAQKEAQKLEGKGHTALVLSKGDYNILCVGKFPDKEKAKTLLSKLKKIYRDGFIRRL